MKHLLFQKLRVALGRRALARSLRYTEIVNGLARVLVAAFAAALGAVPLAARASIPNPVNGAFDGGPATQQGSTTGTGTTDPVLANRDSTFSDARWTRFVSQQQAVNAARVQQEGTNAGSASRTMSLADLFLSDDGKTFGGRLHEYINQTFFKPFLRQIEMSILGAGPRSLTWKKIQEAFKNASSRKALAQNLLQQQAGIPAGYCPNCFRLYGLQPNANSLGAIFNAATAAAGNR
jgi:hypothetical protein